jgi:hypothetical protein
MQIAILHGNRPLMQPLRQNKQPHSFYPAVPDRVESRKQRLQLVGFAWLMGMRSCGNDVRENPSATGIFPVRGIGGK